jgi:hypothetical protein
LVSLHKDLEVRNIMLTDEEETSKATLASLAQLQEKTGFMEKRLTDQIFEQESKIDALESEKMDLQRAEGELKLKLEFHQNNARSEVTDTKVRTTS